MRASERTRERERERERKRRRGGREREEIQGNCIGGEKKGETSSIFHNVFQRGWLKKA